MNIRSLTLTLLVSALAGPVASWAEGASLPLRTDRPRIKVVEVPDPFGGPKLKVLRTSNDTPLRAGTAWIWSKQWKEEPASYYADLRSKGFNCVRIILFDTWEQEAGYGGGDWNNATYRTEMLGRLERAVNHASTNGLYVVLNSHNKIPNFDEAYNTALWTHVAPFFANRTHVLYEATNETLDGTGIKADGLFSGDLGRLEALRRNYDLIRSLAPQTHIMVLTPAGVSGWGYVDGMNRLVRRWLEVPGTPVDWSKTSVAYHLYHADVSLFPQAQDLRRFHSEFPGWPSENNFPSSVSSQQLGIPADDTWRSVSYGNDTYVTQTCERLGLGWSHWHLNRQTQLDRNFPLLWDDAKTKGYNWNPDPVTNAVMSIDSGGEGSAKFWRDVNFFGGTVALHDPSVTVDTSGVSRPGPQSLYASERWGAFRYQIAGLSPRLRYSVRLHFTERFSGITAPGQRLFDVRLNGQTALSRFDIFAAAGNRRNKAVVRELFASPNNFGRLDIEFEPIVQWAKVDGLQLSAVGRR